MTAGKRTVIGTWDARWTREQREDAITAAEANLRENRQELDETLAEIQAKGLAIEHAAKRLATAHAFQGGRRRAGP
jgi:hypothetical protein